MFSSHMVVLNICCTIFGSFLIPFLRLWHWLWLWLGHRHQLMEQCAFCTVFPNIKPSPEPMFGKSTLIVQTHTPTRVFDRLIPLVSYHRRHHNLHLELDKQRPFSWLCLPRYFMLISRQASHTYQGTLRLQYSVQSMATSAINIVPW